MRIQLGACTFDALRHEVRRGAEAVHLSPRAFELLRLLVDARPRALAKDELLGRLWPSTFVSEASLAGLVAEIRREIGDDAREPRFLRTVHGYGYAFSDGPSAASDESVCRLIWGPREIPLGDGESTLGRDPDATVAIDDAAVSRLHARILIGGFRAALEDLGSKNGTYLRGCRIACSESLCDGDEIQVGSVAMTFRRFSAGAPTETQMDASRP